MAGSASQNSSAQGEDSDIEKPGHHGSGALQRKAENHCFTSRDRKGNRVCWRPTLGPLGLRALLELAVHVDVHLLVEEGEISLDAWAFQDRIQIAPDDVSQLGIA